MRHLAGDVVKSASRPLRVSIARARLRWSTRKVGVALVYHRVAEREGLEEELLARHDPELFGEHMEHLRAHYRVVPASELVRAAASRRRGERIPAAVTFDDDLESHLDTAAPILRRHGLTATFFLCGASLERPYRFWWERYEAACEAGMAPSEIAGAPGWPSNAAPPATMRAGAEVVQRLDLGARSQLEGWLRTRAGDDPDGSGLRAKAVRTLRDAGFEIGFHTLRHPYLPVLDDDGLTEAMAAGRDALAAVAGTELTTVAYPHGGCDARVAAAARRAGFEYAFTLEPTPATPDGEPLLIGRLETFESRSRFAMQVVRTLESDGQR